MRGHVSERAFRLRQRVVSGSCRVSGLREPSCGVGRALIGAPLLVTCDISLPSFAMERLFMPFKRCPTCDLYNPETAIQCDCGYNFQSGLSQRVPCTMSPHGAQRRRSALWLATLTMLYTVSLLGWPIAFFIIGLTTPLGHGPIVFRLLVAYPFVVLIGLACYWLLYSHQRYRAAFWVSVIPLAHIFFVLLSIALLSRAITGHL